MPSTADNRIGWLPIVLRALVYAVAITALVLWAPGEQHVFIYQGF